jgi:hypothetical protein
VTSSSAWRFELVAATRQFIASAHDSAVTDTPVVHDIDCGVVQVAPASLVNERRALPVMPVVSTTAHEAEAKQLSALTPLPARGVGDAVTVIVLGLTSHKVSPESCEPPTRHWLDQQAADEMVVTVVLGRLGAVQTPLARLTCTTADGATVDPLAPAATQAPDVVQATLCSGTSMLSDGAPVRWGPTTTFALPHPASTRAATPTTNAPRHERRAVAVARLMAFPVFSRHVPLYR